MKLSCLFLSNANNVFYKNRHAKLSNTVKLNHKIIVTYFSDILKHHLLSKRRNVNSRKHFLLHGNQ